MMGKQTNWCKKIRILLAVPAGVICVFGNTLAQCPMCRTALVSSLEGQQMAGGFNRGILFLLGAPLLVVGAAALLIFRSHWQQHRSSSPR